MRLLLDATAPMPMLMRLSPLGERARSRRLAFSYRDACRLFEERSRLMMQRSATSHFLRLPIASRAFCLTRNCNRGALDILFSQSAPRDSFRGGWQSHTGMTSSVALLNVKRFNNASSAELSVGSVVLQRCSFPHALCCRLLRQLCARRPSFVPCIPCSLVAACAGQNMTTAPVMSHAPVAMTLCLIVSLVYTLFR